MTKIVSITSCDHSPLFYFFFFIVAVFLGIVKNSRGQTALNSGKVEPVHIK